MVDAKTRFSSLRSSSFSYPSFSINLSIGAYNRWKVSMFFNKLDKGYKTAGPVWKYGFRKFSLILTWTDNN